MRKTEKQCPVTLRYNSAAVHELVPELWNNFQEMLQDKKQNPGFAVYVKEEFRYIKQHPRWTQMEFWRAGKWEVFFFFMFMLIKGGNFLLLPLDEKAYSGDVCKWKFSHSDEGKGRKPVADWIYDKMWVFLNGKSWCIQEKWHTALME